MTKQPVVDIPKPSFRGTRNIDEAPETTARETLSRVFAVIFSKPPLHRHQSVRSLLAPSRQVLRGLRFNQRCKAALVKQEELEHSTHRQLQDAVAELEKALAELDLKALKAISLEAEKGKTGST
jgi:hypothetical protein